MNLQSKYEFASVNNSSTFFTELACCKSQTHVNVLRERNLKSVVITSEGGGMYVSFNFIKEQRNWVQQKRSQACLMTSRRWPNALQLSVYHGTPNVSKAHPCPRRKVEYFEFLALRTLGERTSHSSLVDVILKHKVPIVGWAMRRSS